MGTPRAAARGTPRAWAHADWETGLQGSPAWSPVKVDWSPVPSTGSPGGSSTASSPASLRPPGSSPASFASPAGLPGGSLDVSPQDRSFLSSVSLEELPERRVSACASRSTSPGSDHGLPVAEGASWRHFDPEKERMIGAGSYAEVVKVYRPDSRRWFALKRSRGGSARARRHLRRELANFARLRSVPGIVRLHAAWEEAGRVCLQLELCLGSAADLARRLGPMVETEALSCLWQILAPLEHLHACGLSHLDLKPDNVLFKLNDASEGARGLDDPLAPFGGDCAEWRELLAAGRFKLADLSLMGGDANTPLGWGSSTVAAGCFVPVELIRAAASADQAPSLEIDPRACDVYGAGACTLFMLRVAAPARDDVTDEVVDIDQVEVCDGFRDLLGDLLSPRPAARGSAREATARVREIWDGRPPASVPPSPATTPPPARSPSPVPNNELTPKRRHFPRSVDAIFL